MHMCIWPFAWCNKYKPLQSIDISSVIAHCLVQQSKRKRSNEGTYKRIHHGAIQINLDWNNRSVVAYWYSVLYKNWPYCSTSSGSYGRQVGRQNKGGFWDFYNSLHVQLFGLLFCLLIPPQCYSSIRTVGFYQLKLILRHVLKCEKFDCHFFMSTPTIKY